MRIFGSILQNRLIKRIEYLSKWVNKNTNRSTTWGMPNMLIYRHIRTVSSGSNPFRHVQKPPMEVFLCLKQDSHRVPLCRGLAAPGRRRNPFRPVRKTPERGFFIFFRSFFGRLIFVTSFPEQILSNVS